MKVEKFSQQNSILNRHGYRSSSQESSIIIISGYNLRQIDYTMLPFVRLCVSFLPPLRWGGGAICTGNKRNFVSLDTTNESTEQTSWTIDARAWFSSFFCHLLTPSSEINHSTNIGVTCRLIITWFLSRNRSWFMDNVYNCLQPSRSLKSDSFPILSLRL